MRSVSELAIARQAPHASGYVTAKMSPISVSRADARRIWLHAQRLDERKPFGAGQGAVQTTIEHLGYVQIDTINVIERCHHHILFSRIPNYRRADLHHIQSVEKSVFEYWTHALAYVPISDFRFYLRQMRQHRRKPVRWNQAVARRIITASYVRSGKTGRSQSGTSKTTCWSKRSSCGLAASPAKALSNSRSGTAW